MPQVGACIPNGLVDTSAWDCAPGIVRCFDVFVLQGHVCLVLELLDQSVYDILKARNFVGLSLDRIQHISKQLLVGLQHLHACGLSHNDLKPENIMFSKDGSCRLVDFGSAAAQQDFVSSKPYVQSRFYRAPEVLMGCQYSPSVDLWSAGCVLAELWLGLPLFAGGNTWDQCKRITALMGAPPFWMVQFGSQSHSLFEVARMSGRRKGVLRLAADTSQGWSGFCIKLRSEKSWRAIVHGPERDLSAWQQKHLSTTTLARLMALHVPCELSEGDKRERAVPTGKRVSSLDSNDSHSVQLLLFCDLLGRMLQVDPMQRPSASQLLDHPFISGQLTRQQESAVLTRAAENGIPVKNIEVPPKIRRPSASGLAPLPSQYLLEWSPRIDHHWKAILLNAQHRTFRHAQHWAGPHNSSHVHSGGSSPGGGPLPLVRPVEANHLQQANAAPGRVAGFGRGLFSLGRSEGSLLEPKHQSESAQLGSSLDPLKVYGFLPSALLSSEASVPQPTAQRSLSWKERTSHTGIRCARSLSYQYDSEWGRSTEVTPPAAATPQVGTRVQSQPRRSSLHSSSPSAWQPASPVQRIRRFSHNDVALSSTPQASAWSSPPSPASSVDDDSFSVGSLGYSSLPGTPLPSTFAFGSELAVTQAGVSCVVDSANKTLTLDGQWQLGQGAACCDADDKATEGQTSPIGLNISRRRSSIGSMFSVGSSGFG